MEALHSAIRSGALPVSGCGMIHFDAHPDLSVPRSLPASWVFAPARLLHHLSSSPGGIAEWILPAVFAGHLSTVKRSPRTLETMALVVRGATSFHATNLGCYRALQCLLETPDASSGYPCGLQVWWVRQPWAGQIEDGSYGLHVGAVQPSERSLADEDGQPLRDATVPQAATPQDSCEPSPTLESPPTSSPSPCLCSSPSPRPTPSSPSPPSSSQGERADTIESSFHAIEGGVEKYEELALDEFRGDPELFRALQLRRLRVDSALAYFVDDFWSCCLQNRCSVQP